jgi:hypothetical protein
VRPLPRLMWVGRRKATFCEQKVAKKLCYLGPCSFLWHGPNLAEVFAPLFSKNGHLLKR